MTRTRSHGLPRSRRPLRALAALGCALAGSVLAAACGGDSNDGTVTPDPDGGGGSALSVLIDNQVALASPCMGASLTFFEGSTPVDIAYQAKQSIQITPLFGAFEIGFQVNGWYWRSCEAPGDCPNPKNCQNPDNAGQVGIEVAPDCSSATLLQNWDQFTCDDMVPNASNAVSVSVESTNPCTVKVEATGDPLTPTEQCCSCQSCTASETPAGQILHCE